MGTATTDRGLAPPHHTPADTTQPNPCLVSSSSSSLSLSRVVPLLRQFVGRDAVCYVREVSEVDPKTKRMVLRSKNITYSNLLTVEETCTYTEHEAETSTTRFTQQAVFSACGVSISSMRRTVEDTCAKNFVRNAERGRQGLDQVIESIVEGGRDLGRE